MVLRGPPSGHLYLGGSHKYRVHRELVNKLAIHQLEAVRFLYAQFREYTGIFLNDESGLGKCYQTVAFLSALAVSEDHSLILCPNRDRLHHWTYHLDALAPSLRTKVHPKSYLDADEEQSALRGTDWQYVVVDETREFMTEKQLETLRSFAVKRYIFVSSLDLLDRLDVLIKRLDFCYPRDPSHLRAVIEQQHKGKGTKEGSFKLYLCTRRFILRRSVKSCRQSLPLIERNKFLESFHAWSVANGVEIPVVNVLPSIPQPEAPEACNNLTQTNGEETLSETMTPYEMEREPEREKDSTTHSPVRCGREEFTQPSPDHAIEAVPLHCVDSEPLFEPNETNTELMPVLRVESDTPSEGNTIPETATDSEGYMQFGQEISSHGYVSSQPSQLALATERYRFPIEKFLRSQGQLKSSSSSVSVESIPNGQPFPTGGEIVISSSDSPQRAKSPPLFDDSDHDTKSLSSCTSDTEDDISLMAILASSRNVAPIGERVPSPSLAPRRQPSSFSTPIAKLMFGPLANPAGSEAEPVNVSSVDMFDESLGGGENVDNVFEITKNNAFPNRIVVRSEVNGAASLKLANADDSSDEDVQFVNETNGCIIDLVDDIVSTPKSDILNRAVVCQTTPPSGTLNPGLSPGRGWLGKSLRTASLSPASGKNTPSTSRGSPNRRGGGSGGSTSNAKPITPIVRDSKRRRKLDDVFQTMDLMSEHFLLELLLQVLHDGLPLKFDLPATEATEEEWTLIVNRFLAVCIFLVDG
uniref:SNF2 N-terminal domain-containing protein n=1 Tax=Anopheles culicifacies TaxID=139723 RepID=A0A182MWN7_9DIPT